MGALTEDCARGADLLVEQDRVAVFEGLEDVRGPVEGGAAKDDALEDARIMTLAESVQSYEAAHRMGYHKCRLACLCAYPLEGGDELGSGSIPQIKATIFSNETGKGS